MGVPKRKNGLSSPKLPFPCNSLPDLKKLFAHFYVTTMRNTIPCM